MEEPLKLYEMRQPDVPTARSMPIREIFEKAGKWQEPILFQSDVAQRFRRSTIRLPPDIANGVLRKRLVGSAL